MRALFGSTPTPHGYWDQTVRTNFRWTTSHELGTLVRIQVCLRHRSYTQKYMCKNAIPSRFAEQTDTITHNVWASKVISLVLLLLSEALSVSFGATVLILMILDICYDRGQKTEVWLGEKVIQGIFCQKLNNGHPVFNFLEFHTKAEYSAFILKI